MLIVESYRPISGMRDAVLVRIIVRRYQEDGTGSVFSPHVSFFLFSTFRCWTSGGSDGGDRRVQVLVSKAVCSCVRLRWPRHPARHPVFNVQHLQWQRPVSRLTLNENERVLYHLITTLTNLKYVCA